MSSKYWLILVFLYGGLIVFGIPFEDMVEIIERAEK